MQRIWLSACVVFWMVAGASWAVAQEEAPAVEREVTGGYGSERHRLVSQPDEVITTLENGMTVVAKRVPSPVVSVRGYVYTGGVYEGRWLGGGLSHLLEHLVAGGSTERRTEAENRELLQRIGNESNAYTTYDHTGYFINTTPQHMEEAVDLLTGWLLGALITEEEYRREYEVVQRELEQGRGQPRRQFWYLSSMNRYRVSPLRVPVIGYQEVIRGLSRDDVYEYYRLTYQPQNILLSIAGDVDPEEVVRTVRRYVGDAPPGREFVRSIPEEPPVQAPRTVVATFPQLGQAQLELGFPTIRLEHEDLYALDLLASVLGWGEGSLFVEEIRDRRRLVSSISVWSWTPHFAEGTFSISMQLSADNVAEATDAVLELIEQVKNEGVSEDRLERAKAQTRTSHIRGQQTAEAIASSLARDYMSTGDPHFGERYVERIMEVTAEQVQEMARKYLDRGVLLTTVMLPAEHVAAEGGMEGGMEGLPAAVELIRPVAPTVEEEPAERISPITRLELENGTILLHRRITTTPLVSAQMFSLGGLTAEDGETNGLGNLAMRMLMRGTETRSASEIAGFFDSIGAEMSATMGNQTWYWQASFLNEDAERAMEVIADVVLNPTFPEEELETVRQRVLAQIAQQDSDWSGQAMRFFRRAYFGPRESPYQFQTTGEAEKVGEYTREQIAQWYEERVLPSRRVLAIFGDIELERARELAEQFFGEMPALREGVAVAVEQDKETRGQGDKEIGEGEDGNEGVARVTVERVEVQETRHPLAGVVIGFNSNTVIGEPAAYPITVGNTMASGYRYPTGYLHETLRGRGLVYVVHATNMPGRSEALPGTFLVYAGCEPGQVNDVVELILENIARLQGSEEDLQPGWFERSKELIITNEALSRETAGEQAMAAALDELYGLGYDHHEQFDERIEAVTIPQLRSTARERLVEAVVTISTPAPEVVDVETGERDYEEFHPVDLTPRGVEHAPVGGPQ